MAPSDVILSSNGDISGYAGNSEQEKSLLTKVNPVQKPPRRHERPSVTTSGTELTEMKCNLLDNGTVFRKYRERSQARKWLFRSGQVLKSSRLPWGMTYM
jgi:hypothetical protein